MNRIEIQEGGFPLRAEDILLLQENLFEIQRHLTALVNHQPCILKGMHITQSGNAITCQSGILYVNEEIFLVPGATFTYNPDQSLYLVPHTSMIDNRIYADGQEHACQQIRIYIYQYTSTPPVQSLALNQLKRLSDLVHQSVKGFLIEDFALNKQVNLSYQAGFTAANQSQSATILYNDYGNIMITAQFNASQSNGVLFVMPQDLRPPQDIVTSFFNGTTNGILVLKANGQALVYNASLSATNYITFQFKKNFEPTIFYNIAVQNTGPNSN
ncbi:MAG: hypothetical protein ACK4EX_02500 [Thermaurantimonas sp.]|uniref:Uncharacterized protein n=1 Tax=Thermaurantimonas aggregans TaxID=2173829 RepID=A0A401XI11_9FLAO|nr:hypothetical protein [Thermaurantimonas aggregans]MCX8149204.1 hypothetical protein [Thermaurantimonas aggregans]GCD76646.1 hypothetical protein JCM31826_01280 [Thermaurantimonas aggregans]